MADYVIKKQIIGHLSKFAKNKTEKNLTVSSLRGKGVMSDLELDENVLTEFLELPSWIKVTNATCNKIVFDISLKIPNSCPLKLIIDEINVEIVTCEELRSTNPESVCKLVEEGSYGLKNRIIDGAAVSINTINVRFLSRNYVASIMVSNVSVVSDMSNNAKWILKGPNGHILIRKVLTWQNLKFEVKPPPGSSLHPFRLITEKKGTFYITLKKKSEDCSCIGSRMTFHMQELGWPLTDDQVKTLVDFIAPITQLLEKSMERDHQEFAGRKLQNLYEDEQIKSQSQQAKGDAVYHRFDFIETSFHLLLDCLEFYLYDESQACRSSHPELRKGSSLVVHLGGLQVDYYPYHLSSKSRGHWLGYTDNILSKWHRADHQGFYQEQFPFPSPNGDLRIDEERRIELKRRRSQLQNMLMNLCFVVRLNDVKVYKVNKKEVFLSVLQSSKSSDLNSKHDKTVLHLEFLSYYTPGNFSRIIPSPKLYGYVRCMNINVDALTILWLNSYFLHLHGTFQSVSQKSNTIATSFKADIQEVNVVFEYHAHFINQKDRPTKMHIKCSGVHVFNDIQSSNKREDLQESMKHVVDNDLFSNNKFPGREDDFCVLHPDFLRMTGRDERGARSGDYNGNQCGNQVWCVFIDMLLGNFLGLKISHKPVPFFDTVKLNMWMFYPESHDPLGSDKASKTARLNVLISISNLFKLQINHYQYLFVMRLLETFNELNTVLANDTVRFGEVSPGMCVCVLLSRITASFLMPPQLNEKSSSKGDITPESLLSPDPPIKRESESLSDISCYCPKDPLSSSNMFSSYHEDAFPCDDFEILTPDASHTAAMGTDLHRRASSSLSSRSASWIDSISTSLTSLKEKTLDLSSLSIKESVLLELHDTSGAVRFTSEPKDTFVEEDIECYTPSKDHVDFTRVDVDRADDASEGTDEVEIASDALEEFNPKDLYFCGRSDPISVVTFHLGSVDIIQQSSDMSSTLKVFLQKLAIEEISTIPYDEFQEKYLNKDINISTMSQSDTRASFTCRMDQSPSSVSKLRDFLPDKSDTHSAEGFERYRRLSALFSSCLETHITNFAFKVSLSSVIGLINLVEDEVIHRPYPVKLHLKDLSVHLVDDRQASSITSPDLTSFGLTISSLMLLRNSDGNYSVCSSSEPPGCDLSEISRLKKENDLLRSRLEKLEERLNEQR